MWCAARQNLGFRRKMAIQDNAVSSALSPCCLAWEWAACYGKRNALAVQLTFCNHFDVCEGSIDVFDGRSDCFMSDSPFANAALGATPVLPLDDDEEDEEEDDDDDDANDRTSVVLAFPEATKAVAPRALQAIIPFPVARARDAAATTFSIIPVFVAIFHSGRLSIPQQRTPLVGVSVVVRAPQLHAPLRFLSPLPYFPLSSFKERMEKCHETYKTTINNYKNIYKIEIKRTHGLFQMLRV